MLTASLALAASVAFSEPEYRIPDGAIVQWVAPVRVELETPGGPLPFIVEHKNMHWPEGLKANTRARKEYQSLDDEGKQKALRVIHEWEQFAIESLGVSSMRIVNGTETITIEFADRRGETIAGLTPYGTIRFDPYDSTITGTSNLVGTNWGLLTSYITNGEWTKRRGDSVATIALAVTKVESRDDRFDPIDTDAPRAEFTGRWRVDFESSDDDAIGVFEVDDDGIATGTFLTTTGDYRYLAGRVDGDLMRLSTFDGAHAFLFHATMNDDGSIAGDFWSGNWWHETWTATRDEDIELPDMFEQTTIQDEAALDDLVFTDLSGDPARVVDVLDATGAPARIIEVFGTWCPNCADAAKELASLKQTYRDQLGIVGLAFELTDDHARSVEQVNHYKARHGIAWDVLVAGISDKDAATQELKILDKVRSYPTTIFLNADNEVVEIHTGFTGPATGDAYTRQHERYRAIIESLIAGEASP